MLMAYILLSKVDKSNSTVSTTLPFSAAAHDTDLLFSFDGSSLCTWIRTSSTVFTSSHRVCNNSCISGISTAFAQKHVFHLNYPKNNQSQKKVSKTNKYTDIHSTMIENYNDITFTNLIFSVRKSYR
ncbi:hypothetical protein TNIN_273421 [Trichonephila inaurata madagascariensis]|uniref:Uncharacterized protein n=1 Tax=Trichonephila inaurata madagascariensis TaxID=2747483 RepID=A0A8X6YU31_9ARAC|nr:hypothetical protein TNIN_273421 [Trichonephila inaurata madagascariensis]